MEAFFEALYRRCSGGYLTMTAIHPTQRGVSPSWYVAAQDKRGRQAALAELRSANAQGWGVFFGIGLRRRDLGRGRRGSESDVVSLPALYADLDCPLAEVPPRLATLPTPSAIIGSGGGAHVYWFLAEPLTDFALARRLLRQIALQTGGDRTAVAQCLRVPNSRNTKPHRHGAWCRVLWLGEFSVNSNQFSVDSNQFSVNSNQFSVDSKQFSVNSRQFSVDSGKNLITDNCKLPTPITDHCKLSTRVARLSATLRHMGYVQRGEWLCGPCPHAERHAHGDAKPSFGFNTRTGYGNCYVCGSMLLKDLEVWVG